MFLPVYTFRNTSRNRKCIFLLHWKSFRPFTKVINENCDIGVALLSLWERSWKTERKIDGWQFSKCKKKETKHEKYLMKLTGQQPKISIPTISQGASTFIGRMVRARFLFLSVC